MVLDGTLLQSVRRQRQLKVYTRWSVEVITENCGLKELGILDPH